MRNHGGHLTRRGWVSSGGILAAAASQSYGCIGTLLLRLQYAAAADDFASHDDLPLRSGLLAHDELRRHRVVDVLWHDGQRVGAVLGLSCM